MSTEVLSRIQFALTASFHFLFPPMSIGLGLMLVAIQGLRLWRGNQLYVDMARFWTRASGSSSPSVLPRVSRWSFRSGLTGRYARFVGDIFGSPLAIEDIYAFFLESGFLALLLFGWHKIGPRALLLDLHGRARHAFQRHLDSGSEPDRSFCQLASVSEKLKTSNKLRT
jgi:cytochrome d ubiquinol oxidase subunit I